MADTFLQTYAPLANDIAARTGLDATVVLGLIDTETGRGQHVVGSNIYGISPTRNGRQYVERYPDVETATEAFINLMNSPGYAGVAKARDPAAQAAALVRSGYNTVNSNYARLVGGKAQAFGKALGYQDAAPAQPAAAATPAVPAQPAAAAPASPKERALAEVGGGDTAAPTATAAPAAAAAAPQSARDRALAEVDSSQQDPAFTGPKTAEKTTAAPQTPPTVGVDEYGRELGAGGFPVGDSPLGPGPETVGSVVQAFKSDQDMRSALAPAEGTTYGEVLPFAKDDKTGEIRLALPEGIRGFARGLYDLTQGPATGTVTPEGTNALAGIMMGGLTSSPAAGTGKAIGGRLLQQGDNALGRTEMPDLLGTEFRAAPTAPPTAEVPNPLAPSATGPSMPNPSVPPEAPPAPTPPAGRGGAVGADVTTAPIPPKTPVERVRDLEKAVLQTAEERAGPQLVDNAPYVPGIPARLLPSRDFSKSVNALDAKVASARDPAFRDAVDANARVRNEGMVDHLREGAGDLTALEQAHEARSAVSPSAMRGFEGEKPVDAAGLLAKIDETLNGPEGKQKAVRTTLSDVRASLFDGDGNLETMPSRLYGARRNLTDLLKKGVKGTGDLADDVRASKHILNGLLEDFDPLITNGAPRFTEYLKAWSEASKPIDQMEFLQNYFSGSKKITNDAGYLQPGKVQKMFDDVLQGNKARGVNKAKSLTDEQIARIEAVRNELQADQLRDRLASTRGSDTFQQFNSRMFGEGPVVNALRHGRDIALGAATGGIYNLGVKPIMETNRLRRIERKTEARKRQLLEEGPNALGPD